MDTHRSEDQAVHHPAGAPAPAARKGGPLSGGLGVIVSVVVLGCAAYLGWNYYKNMSNMPAEAPRDVERTFLCADANKSFVYRLQEGESPPVPSPHSGKRTGYPAEFCWWTREGTIRETPTPVILNHYLGKQGDTICPDCGRVVVGHNPDPRRQRPTATEPARDARPDA
jgi:hypothetical protein